MKKWQLYTICTLIAIGFISKAVEAPFTALIALAAFSVIGALWWLYKKEVFNESVINVLRKVGYVLFYLFAIALVGIFLWGTANSMMSDGGYRGLLIILFTVAVVSISAYMTKDRRWMMRRMKYLDRMIPDETYGLRKPVYSCWGDGVTYILKRKERKFVIDGLYFWLSPTESSENELQDRLEHLKKNIQELGISPVCQLDYKRGSIFACLDMEFSKRDITTERFIAISRLLTEVQGSDYNNRYYIRCENEDGIFLAELEIYHIIRAVHIPQAQWDNQKWEFNTEDFVYEYGYGTISDVFYEWLSRWPQWEEDRYSVIDEDVFYEKWHEWKHFMDTGDAGTIFVLSAVEYFAAAEMFDEKGMKRSFEDIRMASECLLNDKDGMTVIRDLLDHDDEGIAYWAAIEFASVCKRQDTIAALEKLAQSRNRIIEDHASKALEKMCGVFGE